MGPAKVFRADMAVQGRIVDAATAPEVIRKSRFDGLSRFTCWLPFWVVRDITSKQVRRDATHSRSGEIGFKDDVVR